MTPHARPTPLFSHTRRDSFDWGNFYTDRGQLVGHYALDVNAWLAQHPDYSGSLFFDYGQGDDQIDVTDIFFSAEIAPDHAL